MTKLQSGGSQSAWLGATGGMVLLFITALVAWSYLTFGSLGSAWDYVRGERISVDSYTKSFGTLTGGGKGKVSFEIRNMSGKPVTILGAKASCTCALVQDLPAIVHGGSTYWLNIRVTPKKTPGTFSESIEVYTDSDHVRVIVLSILGDFK